MVNNLKTVNLNLTEIILSSIIDYGSKTAEKAEQIKFLSGFIKKIKNVKLPNKFNFKNLDRKKVIISLGALVVVIAVVAFVFSRGDDKFTSSLNAANSGTDFSPQTQSEINKNFEIPIRQESGESTDDKLKISLTTADFSNRILIQGKGATAREGKAFLIINMEIDNDTSNQLSVRPVDFVRLVDSQGKNYAPDVHNEEVSVEPISIKKTRVGYVVDDIQKSFKFLIGEVNGDKQEIEINF